MESHHKKALILGTGGASKGVAFALEELGIDYTFVSRQASDTILGYNQITDLIFDEYQIVINASPVGTSPNTDAYPEIPYDFFTKKHIAYDLIYNPAETQFLKKPSTMAPKPKTDWTCLFSKRKKLGKFGTNKKQASKYSL